MAITFYKSKQTTWFPEKGKIIQIPHQKGVKEGDEIIIDKVLEAGEGEEKKYGQPYLPIKLIAKVTNSLITRKKIHGMKYKSKKRNKRIWGHREKWTEIEIVSIKEE